MLTFSSTIITSLKQTYFKVNTSFCNVKAYTIRWMIIINTFLIWVGVGEVKVFTAM